jgi:CheY-like chemotaxis protein
MQYLDKAEVLPDIIFVDMNMPRKNGAVCLTEIKSIEKLKFIPVVIISTSLEQSLIQFLYANGAHYFIRKPNAFSKLKFLLYHSITLLALHDAPQPALEYFILPDEKVAS